MMRQTAIAKAVEVCDDGHPQKIPCRKMPKLNPCEISTIPAPVGGILPVKALYIEAIVAPRRAAWPRNQP